MTFKLHDLYKCNDKKYDYRVALDPWLGNKRDVAFSTIAHEQTK